MPMTGVQLYGADIEVQNAGGSSGDKVPDATALRLAVDNEATGHLETAYGLKVEMVNNGVRDNAYAIHTDEGLVHLGDALEVPIVSTGNEPGTAPSGQLRVYFKLNVSNQPELYAKDTNGTEYKVTLT